MEETMGEGHLDAGTKSQSGREAAGHVWLLSSDQMRQVEKSFCGQIQAIGWFPPLPADKVPQITDEPKKIELNRKKHSLRLSQTSALHMAGLR